LPNINKSWVTNDVVEVYEFDCWWVGKIICRLPCETKYVIYFLESSQEMQIDASCAHVLVKIGCNQTMHVILFGNCTLLAWYALYFIQLLSFFLKIDFERV
jgi:hypothetical protein